MVDGGFACQSQKSVGGLGQIRIPGIRECGLQCWSNKDDAQTDTGVKIRRSSRQVVTPSLVSLPTDSQSLNPVF